LHPDASHTVLSEPPHWKQIFIPFGGLFAIPEPFDGFNPIRSQPVMAKASNAPARPLIIKKREKFEFFCMILFSQFLCHSWFAVVSPCPTLCPFVVLKNSWVLVGTIFACFPVVPLFGAIVN
jgi:hypothetical protein